MFRRKKKEEEKPKGPPKWKREDLYDSHGNLIPDDEDDEDDDPKRKRDKIFGNAYNSGDTDFQTLPDIKAESEYAHKHLSHVYETEDYNIKMSLSQECSDIFDESQWAGLPKNKKFSKELMPYIFNDLFTAMDKDGRTTMDVFIAIAEFMDVSYEKVYWAAGMKVKERLIAECNVKFGSLDSKNIDRLF